MGAGVEGGEAKEKAPMRWRPCCYLVASCCQICVGSSKARVFGSRGSIGAVSIGAV